ncbi:hypothetical protein [Piscibacillus halophilus]|uniref:hypothetical protein n=1 Tax=Piscibacillus halophilus TaxID=571933 RepID=UPI002409A31C|nr:hypothetical protein [Piscibacillus halophilus]
MIDFFVLKKGFSFSITYIIEDWLSYFSKLFWVFQPLKGIFSYSRKSVNKTNLVHSERFSDESWGVFAKKVFKKVLVKIEEVNLLKRS